MGSHNDIPQKLNTDPIIPDTKVLKTAAFEKDSIKDSKKRKKKDKKKKDKNKKKNSKK